MPVDANDTHSPLANFDFDAAVDAAGTDAVPAEPVMVESVEVESVEVETAAVETAAVETAAVEAAPDPDVAAPGDTTSGLAPADVVVADLDEPEGVADEAVLVVAENALGKVLDVRNGEEDPESLALRVEVTGVNGVDYTYDLAFETIAELQGPHRIYRQLDLTIAIPEDSVEQLFGAVLDLPSNAAQGGLVIRNPNRPNPLAGKHLELTGDIAEQVNQLIAEAINPGLAAHGGFTSLVGVEGTKVFLTMGGGCQGCSLSAATMVQGIQSAIKEAIPEVTEVVDVTDHTAGSNPYFD